MATNLDSGFYNLAPSYPSGFNAALSFVTPFTHRTNISYAELLMELYKWLRNQHLPELEEVLKNFSDKYAEDFKNLKNEIDGAKLNWQNLFDEFIENVTNNLMGLNDESMKRLISDTLSKTRIALNENFADLETQTTVKTGRLSGIEGVANRLTSGVGAATNLPSQFPGNSSIIAIGRNAMGEAKQMKTGIAIGSDAMQKGTMSRDNIAIGDSSLRNVQGETADYDQARPAGTRNIAIGGNAGYSISNGRMHVMIGRNAGQNVVSGAGVTAIGAAAHSSTMPIGLSGEIENWAPAGGGSTSIPDITAIGYSSLSQNTGFKNTAIGSRTLTANTVGTRNVAIGDLALTRLGSDTWVNGQYETVKNINGSYVHSGNQLLVTAVGHGANVGDIILVRLLTGSSATFAGDRSPARVTSVSGDTVTVSHPVSASPSVSGDALLASVISGTPNPALSVGNTAIGSTVAPFLIKGVANTFVGKDSGYDFDDGEGNTAVGADSLKRSERGRSVYNTAVGYGSLRDANGDYNTAIGGLSLISLKSGEGNTAIGYGAGRFIYGTSDPMTSATNTTCIGRNARVSGDNQMQLGDGDTTVYAFAPMQTRSDLRDKSDIRETVLGLDFVNLLKPVDYKWDAREDYEDFISNGEMKRSRYHHGFIAQDIESIIKETGVDFGGYQNHIINGGADLKTVGYAELIAPMVKAIQELSARVKELEEK